MEKTELVAKVDEKIKAIKQELSSMEAQAKDVYGLTEEQIEAIIMA
jgi:hypothetical protein